MSLLLSQWTQLLPLAEAAQQSQQQSPWGQMLLMFGPIALIFYFLILRPQGRQKRERAAMLDALKKGDRIITRGGIHGIITLVRDRDVKLRVSDTCELTLSKSGVAGLLSPEGEENKEDKGKEEKK